MNERLNGIIERDDETPLTSEERSIIYDYFNLCGEEFLYYSHGYILPSVWKAWENGMRYFFCSPRISDVWKNEKISDSYYGLEINCLFP